MRCGYRACHAQGKLTIKHEKVNLKRVVDDVIDLCQPLAKRGVKLVNDLRENVPFVLGDTGRIIQVRASRRGRGVDWQIGGLRCEWESRSLPCTFPCARSHVLPHPCFIQSIHMNV